MPDFFQYSSFFSVLFKVINISPKFSLKLSPFSSKFPWFSSEVKMNQLSMHKSISSSEIPCCVSSIIHLFHQGQQEMLFRENPQAQTLSVVYFPHTPPATTLTGKGMSKFLLVAVHGLFHSLLQQQCQKFSTPCVKQFFLLCVFKRSCIDLSIRQFQHCATWSVAVLRSHCPPPPWGCQSKPYPPSAFSSARKVSSFLVPPHKADSAF